jgi:hypothetical protein
LKKKLFKIFNFTRIMYDQKIRTFLLKKFIELKSPTLVQRAFRTKFVNHTVPSRSCITNIAKRFNINSQLFKTIPTCRTKRVKTTTLIKGVKNLIIEDKTLSIRKIAKFIPASHETVRSVLRKDLKMKPYKNIKTFKLLKLDKEKRLKFANWVINKRINLQKWLICSDEAYFYLYGGHNVQNNRTWSTHQPNKLEEQPLFDQKLLVWCAFSANHVYGPYFFEKTVKWTNYLSMLQQYFWKKHSKVENYDKYYFQQDGAPPHRKKEIQEWLKYKFGDHFIPANFWPPRSPDLNPCDFTLWGTLKARVYDPKPSNLDELKQNIRREIKIFAKSEIKTIFFNMKKRCDFVIQEKGGHIEHLL